MGLVASEIQRRGIPTVTLAVERGVTAPRVAYVPFPYNFPMGGPGDGARHREVALSALELLSGASSETGEHELPFEWR
ncbi:hypothetical protein [Rubrobacter aplysinae]|uniref:hypothetical protein n=1 Tax=Rubrobacter aplysinae TaxID=909625 RepID=UPI00064B8299|nr:hypothetical protein [Rubrobacter aplysinae]